jgi:hypothetical protein
MVHVKLFEKIFAVDLAAPDGPARWWFDRSWVNHGLTNEEVLFNHDAEPCEGPDRHPRDVGPVCAQD